MHDEVTRNFCSLLTTITDTTKLPPKSDSASLIKNSSVDTFPNKDSLALRQKVDSFPLKLSKDSLDAPVNYEAKDSAVILIQEKKILMYGKTKTEYKDITLTAPKVELDQQTEIVTAVNKKDSYRRCGGNC